jgi:hypothetical protein
VFSVRPYSLSLSLSLSPRFLSTLIGSEISGEAMVETKFVLVLAILATGLLSGLESKCPKTCDLALGSYYISTTASIEGINLTYIASLFGMTAEDTLPYNPTLNKDFIQVSCAPVISSLSHCKI